MSTPKIDILKEMQVGDTLKYLGSHTGLYEVVSLDHPIARNCVELKYVGISHRSSLENSFEFHKSSINNEFNGIYRKASDRKLALMASLLLQVRMSGDMSNIHDLLVKLDI
jgi:hypothetical protein